MPTLQLSKQTDWLSNSSYCKALPATQGEAKIAASSDFEYLDIDNLIDYIIATHHSFVRKNVVIIYNLAHEVAYRHGEKNPELLQFTDVAFLYFHDLLNNLKVEEQILFPNIKQLFKWGYYKETSANTSFNRISDTVMQLQKKQLAAYIDLRMFRKLTDNYRLPEDAGDSHRFLFQKMKEFENDLVLHANLENTILFPKAVAMEKEFQTNIYSV